MAKKATTKRPYVRKPSKKIYKDKSLQSLRSSVHWTILNKKNLAAGNKEYAYFIKTELERQWREGTRNDIVIGDKVIKFRSIETIIAQKFASKHIAGRKNKAGAWDAIRAYKEAVGGPKAGSKPAKKKKDKEEAIHEKNVNRLIELVKESKLPKEHKEKLLKKVKSLKSPTKGNKKITKSMKKFFESKGKRRYTMDVESRKFWSRVQRGEFDPNSKADQDKFEEEDVTMDEQEEILNWEEEYQELEEKLRSASGDKQKIINDIIKLKSSRIVNKLDEKAKQKLRDRDKARAKAYQKNKGEKAGLKKWKDLSENTREKMLKGLTESEFKQIFGFDKKKVKS